jgi:hypothetical protein
MPVGNCEYAVHPVRTTELDDLETHLQGWLGSRIRDLRLDLRGEGLVLHGHAQTYYAKQLAQEAVMQATDLPILANDIEVA